MTKIFLTSSVKYVAHDISRHLKKSPREMKLLFVDTAAEAEVGDLSWLKEDRNSLLKAGFQVSDYTFSGKNKKQIKKRLDEVDILYVSGGNQFHLLKKIQESGCVQNIADFVKKGNIYIGSSSGAIVAGPDIYITRLINDANYSTSLESYKGLGLVDFVVFPHWGSPDFKDTYLNQRLEVTYTNKYKIILLTDNQYVRVKDNWYQIIEVG